jgi:hypothetical protein
MFSLLAIVVTVLVLGLAMLWRGICALSRSRFRSRALGRGQGRGGASLPAVSPAALPRADSSGGHVSGINSSGRW